ncbi:MAG: pantetheine-phosphate adenylyltransferase [Candidatus Aenigmarchaeota archaeon]|nr:pantetheine-phosphate adenylyltransferase [Candidatus Aenigmarchaeota archaeon]
MPLKNKKKAIRIKTGRKYNVACIGGTFDIPIHKGHEALLRKAFERAHFCQIGLVTDEYAWRKGKRGIRQYDERKRSLAKFLSSLRIERKRYDISRLDNFFDQELAKKGCSVEAIIVSTETLPGARGINLIREDVGLRPLDVVEVPMVLASDKTAISSTRIRAEEMDRNGKLLLR